MAIWERPHNPMSWGRNLTMVINHWTTRMILRRGPYRFAVDSHEIRLELFLHRDNKLDTWTAVKQGERFFESTATTEFRGSKLPLVPCGRDGHQPNSRGLYTHQKNFQYKVFRPRHMCFIHGWQNTKKQARVGFFVPCHKPKAWFCHGQDLLGREQCLTPWLFAVYGLYGLQELTIFYVGW